MKKKFTILTAVVMLLALWFPVMGLGQTRTETLKYTLTGTTTGGSSGYASESDITQDNVSWKVTGNTTMNPWRIGGNSIDSVNRPIYSTAAISGTISKITIEHGDASSITVNSMTVTVHSSAADAAAGSNAIATFTPTFSANNTITINTTSTGWTNCFYRIVYNVTVSGSSNRFIQFKNAKFYEVSGDPTATAPSFQPDGGTYSNGSNVSVTLSTTTPSPTIKYSLTSNEGPWTTYTEPFDVTGSNETKTVWAFTEASGYENSSVVSKNYVFMAPLTTIQAIFDAATTAGSTATTIYITFNEWVVSGVSSNGKYIYVTDGEKGFVLYYDTNMSSTFSAGKKLSGTTSASVKLQTGYAFLTNVNASALTIEDGGSLGFANIPMDELSGVNTGALIHYENLLCSKSGNNYLLSDGETSLQLFNSISDFTNPTEGSRYNISGVYYQYNTVKEVLPRSNEDLTPYVGPSISIPTTPINVPCTGSSGNLDITYNNLTVSSTANFGVTFYAADGTTPLTGSAIPSWVGQTITGNNSDGYKFNYSISNYTGTEDRIARLKVYGVNDALTTEVYSDLLTITQTAPVPTYAVLFDTDGGTFIPNSDFTSDDVEKEAGTYNLPSASKDGWSFGGWEDDDTHTIYAANAAYKVSADVSFTAQWSNTATVTYEITSTSSVSATGTAPVGSTADYTQTHATAGQMTSGNSMTLTLSGYQGRIIKSIVLSMKSNSSGGAGNMSATAGSTTLASIATASFNTTSWNGAWSTSYVDITPAMSNANYIIQSGENVVISIAATANSLYCESFTIEYETSDQPIVAVSPMSRTVNYQAHNSGTESLDYSITSLNITSPTYQLAYCNENGDVLSSNPYTWFGASVSESTLSFTTTVNEGSDRTAYFKIYAIVGSVPVYSTLCSVIQTHEPYTYTRVTSTDGLFSGKDYLIVNEGTTKNYAMGEQKSNNRAGVEVTISEGIITETSGVYEFVLSGDDANHWTIYDKTNSGYLYTSDNGNARLKNQTNNDLNGEWSIEFDGEGNATIKTYGHDKYNIIMYNSLFSCYTSGGSYGKVKLYRKNSDKDYEFYSNTTLASATIANDETYTVHKPAVFEVTGTLTSSDPARLVIEDGAQMKISNNGVYATVKKFIPGYGAGNEDAKAGYRLITQPLDYTLLRSGNPGDPLIENTGMLTGKFDFYKWDYTQDQEEWRNYEATGSDFNMNNNLYGYLYANESDVELNFAGPLRNNTSSNERYLTIEGTHAFNGWYLMGNSFVCNGYLVSAETDGTPLPYYKMNDDGDGFTAVSNGAAIAPMEGIFYQTIQDKTVYMVTTAPTPSEVGNGNLNISLAQTVTNRGEKGDTDNAIIRFDGGNTLEKFSFSDNTAKIYIPQDGKDYAVVVAEARGEMPVNFKAAKNGTYTISVETENLEVSYLHLIDHMTGENVDLLQTPSYTFTGKTSDYASRFRLVFNANNLNENDSDEPFAFISNDNIVVMNEGEATLQVIDMLGRVIETKTLNGNATIGTQANGVYVLRLINGDNVKTQKIVVK